MEEWTIYRLGDVINVLDYMRVPLSSKQREFRKGNYPYYGAQGIIDYVDSFLFDGEYLLIAEDGENLKSKKQNIAQIARGRYWVNNHAHIVESNGRCDIRYICYLLNQIGLSGYITGSAQPKLNQANLLAIELRLPCLEVQKRVSDFLATFDDKIELNNRINHNLEEQAQALYKSWFVDFEPFKDGKFVESELGMIPEGWRVLPAESICPINIGKTPPRSEHTWFSSDKQNITWVSISDMGNAGCFINSSAETLTKEAVEKFNIKVVPQGSILLSFKLTIGRVAIAGKELTSNEAIARFEASDYQRSFLFLTLKSYDYSSLGSTSSIATAVNSKIIKSMPIICPTDKIMTDFHFLTNDIFTEIQIRQEETSRLSELRDSLLPKLMSGELKINEIDC